MTIVDKAKASAERAREQAQRGVELGRARIDEMRARRQRSKMLQQLGEACYAEHSGVGTHEAVSQSLAALAVHDQEQQRNLSVRPALGRTGTALQARDIMHPGSRVRRRTREHRDEPRRRCAISGSARYRSAATTTG